jgi:hypothetical protein
MRSIQLLECCARTKLNRNVLKVRVDSHVIRMFSVPGVGGRSVSDGSHVGIWVPTQVADKVSCSGRSEMFFWSMTSRWARCQTIPSTPTVYTRALKNAG